MRPLPVWSNNTGVNTELPETHSLPLAAPDLPVRGEGGGPKSMKNMQVNLKSAALWTILYEDQFITGVAASWLGIGSDEAE